MIAYIIVSSGEFLHNLLHIRIVFENKCEKIQ